MVHILFGSLPVLTPTPTADLESRRMKCSSKEKLIHANVICNLDHCLLRKIGKGNRFPYEMLSRVDAQPGHSERLLVALSIARANRSSSAQTSVKEDNVEGKILQLVLEQNGDIMLFANTFSL